MIFSPIPLPLAEFEDFQIPLNNFKEHTNYSILKQELRELRQLATDKHVIDKKGCSHISVLFQANISYLINDVNCHLFGTFLITQLMYFDLNPIDSFF